MWNSKMKKLVRSLGQHRHTPDIAQVEDSEFKLLFVCDDMMRTHVNYERIKEHSAHAARAFTKPRFDFRVERSTGRGLPFIGRKTCQRVPLRVKGEVHAVLSHHIPELDNHYRNGVSFYRIRVPLLVPYRDQKELLIDKWKGSRLAKQLAIGPDMVCIIEAYMYVAASKGWPEVDAGFEYNWAEIIFPEQPRNWLPKYYRYPACLNRK